MFDEKTGEFLGEFITPKLGGLKAPDHLAFGSDGDFYVSSGDRVENSAIIRYDGLTGKFKEKFAFGGGLIRPFGFTFGPDGYLYVSSFLTDQILLYEGKNGKFIDVFAQGNGLPGGLNGPNDLLFGKDGSLYVTTEGSIKGKFSGLPSQVLRFTPGEKKPTVFIDQPHSSKLEYVSFLGLKFGANGDLFVSDFANKIRQYNSQTGQLIKLIKTHDTDINSSHHAIGSLTFDDDNKLYTVGFELNNNNQGKILRFEGIDNQSLPFINQTNFILVPPTDKLIRPIGILYTSKPLKSVSQDKLNYESKSK
ncbi:copper amine oxidase [Aphanothece sacrum FPU3]|nr:copper amine oxidase [Aphanothece sacrum FPU3]